MSEHKEELFELQGEAAEIASLNYDVDQRVISFSKAMYEFHIQQACSNYREVEDPRVCNRCGHLKLAECDILQSCTNYKKGRDPAVCAECDYFKEGRCKPEFQEKFEF